MRMKFNLELDCDPNVPLEYHTLALEALITKAIETGSKALPIIGPVHVTVPKTRKRKEAEK